VLCARSIKPLARSRWRLRWTRRYANSIVGRSGVEVCRDRAAESDSRHHVAISWLPQKSITVTKARGPRATNLVLRVHWQNARVPVVSFSNTELRKKLRQVVGGYFKGRSCTRVHEPMHPGIAAANKAMGSGRSLEAMLSADADR